MSLITKSQYFQNFDSFVSNSFNSSSLFNIISVNIRSLSSISKFNKFKNVVTTFPKLPDVIAVQETWINQDLVQLYNLPCYKSIHCCRSDTYGGTSVFIRDDIHFTIMTNISANYIDCIALRLNEIKFEGKPLTFISFYKSPKCNADNFSLFLNNMLSSYGRTPCTFAGDANVDALDTNSSNELFNLLSTYDYRNCHELITRPLSGTSIDHIYSNIVKNMFIDSIEFNMSDHNIISCKIDVETKNPDFFRETYTRCDFDRLNSVVQEKLSEVVYSGNASTDTSCFINCIQNAVADCSVTQEKSINLKRKITPWTNGNLCKLILYKDRLLKQRRKHSNNEIEDRLKAISNVIRKASFSSMNNYYVYNLERTKNDLRKSWAFMNESMGRVPRKELCLKDLNGEIIEDEKLKAETLNTYFLNSVNTIKQNIEQFPNDNYNALRTMNTCFHRFEFNTTTEEEVKNVIDGLVPGKSCGHDNIYPKAFKLCVNSITPHLVKILNEIITTSIYPDILKIHKIIPIPKEKGSTTCDQYRPISMLSIIDKVFEKILHNQLFKYFDENKLLNDFQFGFRKACGTEEAVINVQNFICNGLDEGKKAVVGVFYDLSKAFDLIDHMILIQKLESYGVVGKAVLLLKNYLRNRKQFVKINEQQSALEDVKYGVPQGSVLGPLLFSLYINDIKNLGLTGKMFVYADDISLFYPYCYESAVKPYIGRDAALLIEYMRINKLYLNPIKTKLIRFKPYFNFSNQFSVYIDGKEIQEVSSVKFLGIYFQSNLSWDQHINYVKSKVSSAIGILYKFKNKFNEHSKLLIYQALIQSHFNYLSIVYSYKKSVELRSLQRLQNKALKTVANLPLLHSTKSLYSEVFPSILPIYGCYKYQLLVYVFKCLHNIGHHTIKFNYNQQIVNTRNNNLKVALCRTETTKQRVQFSGSSEYNLLPPNIKSINSLCLYKQILKQFLLQRLDELLI